MVDSLEKLGCPNCGKEMKKVPIGSAGITLDVCLDGCGGMFFDNREFSLLSGNGDNINEVLAIYSNKKFTNADIHNEKKRICPCCGSPMAQNPSNILSEIVVDECYSCGGKFLDYGEFEKIVSSEPVDKKSEAYLSAIHKILSEIV